MAKTYPDIGTFTSGQILTAATMNDVGTNLDNFRVPPFCQVYRSSDLTGYVNGAAISWNAEAFDTDGMFTASSTDVTVQTAGIYLIETMVYFTATATVTNQDLIIAIDGTDVAGKSEGVQSSTAGLTHQSITLSLAASKVITVRNAISGGSAYVIKGGTNPSNLTSRLTVAWIGQSS